MNEERPYKRKAVGQRIGQLRRYLALTQIEFAKELNTSVMITEIAEHGIRSDLKDDTAFDISAGALLRLANQIAARFGVSLDWLMYGYGTAFRESPLPHVKNDEITLFFPMTISDKSLADEMYNALLLMNSSLQYESERLALQRAILESIVEKYRLYRQHADASGNSDCANLACKRMLDVINQRPSPMSYN